MLAIKLYDVCDVRYDRCQTRQFAYINIDHLKAVRTPGFRCESVESGNAHIGCSVQRQITNIDIYIKWYSHAPTYWKATLK